MKSLAVIIPVYNGAQYIKRCLDSCIAQTPLSEIIVIDDGSSDDTVAIVSSLKDEDDRIQSLHHPDNLNHGRSASRNLGIRSARSEWITFCDADDYFLPGRFDAFVGHEKSKIDGLFEPVESIYEDIKWKGSMNEVTMVPSTVRLDQLQNYLICHREERISLIGMIIRRSLIMKIPLFDEDLSTGEDTDFIWRITGLGNWEQIHRTKPKIIRSVHGGNTYTAQDNNRDKLTFYKLWYDRQSDLKLSRVAQSRITQSYKFYKYLEEQKKAGPLHKSWLFFKYKMSNIF